jgi:hypothetical protein
MTEAVMCDNSLGHNLFITQFCQKQDSHFPKIQATSKIL